MTIHLHVVRTSVRSETDAGERWCFDCRKRRQFTKRVHVPVDELSYYGPHITMACEKGHEDGDLFPGRVREWE